jgi:hypothetical protein
MMNKRVKVRCKKEFKKKWSLRIVVSMPEVSNGEPVAACLLKQDRWGDHPTTISKRVCRMFGSSDGGVNRTSCIPFWIWSWGGLPICPV